MDRVLGTINGRVVMVRDALMPMTKVYPRVGKSPELYDRSIGKAVIDDTLIVLMLPSSVIKELLGDEWVYYSGEYFYDDYNDHKDDYNSEEEAMDLMCHQFMVPRDADNIEELMAISEERMKGDCWFIEHYYQDTGEVLP